MEETGKENIFTSGMGEGGPEFSIAQSAAKSNQTPYKPEKQHQKRILKVPQKKSRGSKNAAPDHVSYDYIGERK
jgi:hypothetical protein